MIALLDELDALELSSQIARLRVENLTLSTPAVRDHNLDEPPEFITPPDQPDYSFSAPDLKGPSRSERSEEMRVKISLFSSKPDRIDVCLLADCTTSMESFLQEIDEDVRKCRYDVNIEYLNLAFVGYRRNQHFFEQLTSDLTDIEEFIPRVKKFGVSIEAEDIAKAYELALNRINWNSNSFKFIIHITDNGGQDWDPTMCDKLNKSVEVIAERDMYLVLLKLGSDKKTAKLIDNLSVLFEKHREGTSYPKNFTVIPVDSDTSSGEVFRVIKRAALCFNPPHWKTYRNLPKCQRHAQIRAQITNPTYEQNLLKQLGFDMSEFEQPKFDPIFQSSINPSPVTATASNGNGVLSQSQFRSVPPSQNNVPPSINPYQGIPNSIPQMTSILPQPEPVTSMGNTGTSFSTGTPPFPLKRNNTQHASNTSSTDPTNVTRSKSMSGNTYQPGPITNSVVPTAMSEKAQSKLPIDYNTVQPSLPQPFPIQPSVSSNLPITYTSPLAAYMDKLKISENNSSNAYKFSDTSSSYSYSGSSDQPQQTNQASDIAYPGPIPYPGSVVYPGPVPFPGPISPNSVEKQQPSTTPTTNLPPNLPPNNLKFPLPFPNGSINNNAYISKSVTPSLPPYSTVQGVNLLFDQGSSSVNPDTTKTRNMVYMGGDAGVMGSARSTTAIDLCFLVDCTASMESLIDTVRFELYNIIHALSSELQFETANVAFVGYRDFYNKHDQFVIRDFTSDLNEMRNFIANVKTFGNFDNAEDVIGGYDMAVNRIRWTQRNHKLIVHFADYGGHCTGWNSGASDNYSDPNLIQNPRCRPEKMDTYVKDMIENGIYVIFVQLGQPRNTQETVAQIKALFKSYGGTHRFSTQSIGTDYTLIMRDVLNTMKTSLRSSGVKSRNARKYQ
ncbi:hypothetical protein HK098_003497 [Nowakowskiella sp. JEL0407]|nr:hypothetical protein HK098_003497 [Nowakowskiella sp. JEL0407]